MTKRQPIASGSVIPAEEFRAMVGADRPTTLSAQCVWAGLPLPVKEYYFAKPRRWRFDYAWPEHKVAVEQDGGVWIQGRHNRGSGFIKDMGKLNRAAALGWKVLRFTPDQIRNGTALEEIKEVLG